VSICKYLALEQEVELEISVGKRNTNLVGVIKDVQDKIVVVKIRNLLKSYHQILEGAKAHISGRKGSLYFEIPAKVTRGDELPLIKLTPTSETIVTQKREFVRVEDCLPCTFTLLSKDDYEDAQKEHLGKTVNKIGVEMCLPDMWHQEREALDKNGEVGMVLIQLLTNIDRKLSIVMDSINPSGKKPLIQKDGILKNISASGAKIYSNEELTVGDILKLEIILPTFPISPITVFGESVRVERLEKNQQQRFGIVVKYATIREEDQDTLIRYVFQRQRALLRSGSMN